MKFRPLSKRLLIRRIQDKDETTTAGIILRANSTTSSHPVRGVVVAKAHDLSPDAPEVGDEVLFLKYAGESHVIGGEDHLVIPEDKVLAVIEGPGNVEYVGQFEHFIRRAGQSTDRW